MNDLKRNQNLHRSVSLLLRNIDAMEISASEGGISNPALYANGETNVSMSALQLNERCDSRTERRFSVDSLNDPQSPDSEYEDLAFPDSVVSGDDHMPISHKPNEEDEDDDNGSILTVAEIPYTSVHLPPVKFTSTKRQIFIPEVDILVQFTDYERNFTAHILNPNLYTIQFTHGTFQWTIKKRYKDFNSLHQLLSRFRTSLKFPLPTKSHKEIRSSFRNNNNAIEVVRRNTDPIGEQSTKKKKKKKGSLPRFPKRPEALVPFESLPVRMKQLEKYFDNLLNIKLYRDHQETINFLEVSHLSFISALGIKGKEGMLKKRTGSTRPGQAGCNFCGCVQGNCCVRCNYFCSDIVWGQWQSRWVFVKETFFGYIRPKDGSIRCIVLFDQGFDVSSGMYNTGMRNGLQIYTNSRYLGFKCANRRQAKEWVNYLKGIGNSQARDFTCPNQHMSFAPVRPGIQAGWFVDGAGYLSVVADALEAATEDIFIADWWLSPEIYMKRPAIDGDYWRLDKILKRKAEQGIKIFILLYKEFELALCINSYYSKQKLVEQHENIKVIRHPDHARVGVFFWAHHEKLVIIDQTYAFIGGIDLCYGRWDDYKHRLTDLGSVSSTTNTVDKRGSKEAPAVTTKTDPSTVATLVKSSRDILIKNHEQNSRLATLPERDQNQTETDSSVEEIEENVKRNTPEMERKNMLGKLKDNMKTKGRDLMNRITLSDTEHDKSNTFTKKDEDETDAIAITSDLSSGCISPKPFKSKLSLDLNGKAKFWIGKDYTNFIMKDFYNLDMPYADSVDRTTTPRLPWHDIATVVVGHSARDAARHFIERWNAVKLEKLRDNINFPYLMPKSYNDMRVNENFLSQPLQRVTCQVLRSASSWSCGFIDPDCVEQSIHDAYVQTITKAQHYIYIENQFFISLHFEDRAVRNQISETIVKRIIRAYKERKIFRVYIILPLLPGFEGDIGGHTGISLRAILYWNYESISRGKHSLLKRLKNAGIENPSDYISFHGLRTHSVLNNIPVTELIYVHSKLLIADDRTVICGSANINDRSLIGKRDSEVNVIITDEAFEEGRMNGQTYPSGIYAGKLRKFLFKEHLGILDPEDKLPSIDVTDPTIDSFWNGVWKMTSKKNTMIYDEIFYCIPTDSVKSITDLKKYLEKTSLAKAETEDSSRAIEKIQGYVVDLPLEFLVNENLKPPVNTREGIMPTYMWT